MLKVPVIISSDYIVYTEYVEDIPFIHMDVFKWTKTIKQQFLKDWNDWFDNQDEVLYAMPFTDDDKMATWAKITGFNVLEHHKCTDGVTRKLYIKEF